MNTLDNPVKYYNSISEEIEEAVIQVRKFGSQKDNSTIQIVACIAPLYMEVGYTTEDFNAITRNVDDRMDVLFNER